jgi:formylglycine-generating enzyme required for sulfatase activity
VTRAVLRGALVACALALAACGAPDVPTRFDAAWEEAEADIAQRLLRGDGAEARAAIEGFRRVLAAAGEAGLDEGRRSDCAARLADYEDEARALDLKGTREVLLAFCREKSRDALGPRRAARWADLEREAATAAPRGGVGGGPRVPGLRFVAVEAGEYVVGTPEGETGFDAATLEAGERRVRVPEFWISTTEVTREVYAQVIGLAAPPARDAWRPAEGMSFVDAKAFCDRLRDGEKGDPAFEFRPPTEDEWEVACRAGTEPKDYPFALLDAHLDERTKGPESLLQRYAVYDVRLEEAKLEEAEVVGSRAPNPWGLFDMHGNVKEWCTRVPSLAYPPNDAEQPIRGGGYQSEWTRCRAGAREFLQTSGVIGEAKIVGIRVVAVPAR